MSPLASRPRILLVEEDRAVGDLLHYFLEGEGYSLVLASSLEEADALCAQRYQLILMDLFRPSIQSLFSAAQHLKQRYQPTPVGLLSSWEIPPEAARQVQLAFVLLKPFDLDRLLSAVTVAVHSPGGLDPSAEFSEQPEILQTTLG